MADLGTLRPGANDATATPNEAQAWTTIPGATGLADDSDSTYGVDSGNNDHVGGESFALDDTPSDLGNMDTLSFSVRYAFSAAVSNTTYDIQARIVNGGTVLAALNVGGTVEEFVTATTTSTITTSTATAFTYVNTSATKADWDGAILQIETERHKAKGGDGAEFRVYEAFITGTYTAGAAETDAPAGNAAGTGAASAPSTAITASAGNAAGTGAAHGEPNVGAVTPVASAGGGVIPAILALNPTGYWPLNDLSGSTATDYSDNGNDGTYSNTPDLTKRGWDTQYGSLDVIRNGASTEDVTVPWTTDLEIGLDDCTFLIAVKRPTPWYTAEWEAFFGQGGGGPFLVGTQKTVDQLGVYLVDTGYALNSTADLNDGQWHLIMYTLDRSGNVSAYVDGATSPVATSDMSGQSAVDLVASPVGDHDFHIGTGDGPANYYLSTAQYQHAAWWKGTLITGSQFADIWAASGLGEGGAAAYDATPAPAAVAGNAAGTGASQDVVFGAPYIESLGSSVSGNTLDQVSPGKPAGLVVGDLMIALCVAQNGNPSPAFTATGWTQVATPSTGTASTCTVLWKIATSGDVAASTFTFDADSTATTAGAYIARISGAHATSPIADVTQTQETSAVNPNPPASGTVSSDDYLVLVPFTYEQDFGGAIPPDRYEKDRELSINETRDASLILASRRFAGITSEDPGAYTGLTIQNHIYTILIAPAGAAGTNAPAGNAPATGAANDPTPTLTSIAGNAAATGAGFGVSPAMTSILSNALGTGSAHDPTLALTATVENAAGTGVANAATVASGIDATPGNALGAGVAYDAITSLSAPAGQPSGSGVAGSPAASVDTLPPQAAGTATAYDVVPGKGGTVENASGTGEAFGPNLALTTFAVVATGIGAGNDATVSTASSTDAPADPATGTGAGFDPVPALGGIAGNAAGTGTAHDVSPGKGGTVSAATGTGAANDPLAGLQPNAGVATGSGAAPAPDTAVGVDADVATGSGAATDATVSTEANTNAPAGHAAGVGAALGALVGVSAYNGLSAGTGTAYSTSTTIGVIAAHAAATGLSGDVTAIVTASAAVATAVGAAYDALVTTSSSTNAPAGHAAAAGAAYDATVTTDASTNAPAGHATGTGVGFGTSVVLGIAADIASGAGTAAQARADIEALSMLAAAAGAAYDATVTTLDATFATAGVAAGTAAAWSATLDLTTIATASAGVGAAYDATVSSLLPDRGEATGSITARGFGGRVSAQSYDGAVEAMRRPGKVDTR